MVVNTSQVIKNATAQQAEGLVDRVSSGHDKIQLTGCKAMDVMSEDERKIMAGCTPGSAFDGMGTRPCDLKALSESANARRRMPDDAIQDAELTVDDKPSTSPQASEKKNKKGS